jgi:GT2 family glycosyltransferase
VPRVSVITPVYDPSEEVLAACLASVASQSFQDWEHLLVDDASPSPHVARQLEAAARLDPRVVTRRRPHNGGIVDASNDALALASGEIVVLLDHDDLLAPQALERIVEAFDHHDDVDYVYSDEDVLDPTGRCFDPFFKPDWSPERFRDQMYTCHVSAIRRSVVEAVGGFRAGFDGAQDWDLVLRCTEVARRIEHVPEVLYHWRVVPTSVLAGEDVKPYAYVAARRALEEHCARVGIDGEVVEQVPRGYFHVVRRHHEHPLVSIVIPTAFGRGRVCGLTRTMVVDAVRSIVERSTWPAYELVVVADTPFDQAAMDALERAAGERLRVVPFDEDFDFSRKCNLGAKHARGEYLVFLNDDVELIDDHWLEVLVGFAREPDVGAAGLVLLFEDGRVQHAGHVYLGGNPGHLMFGQFPTSERNRLALQLDREVSGVTGACLAIAARTFAEVGGFSEDFPNNYNDVDLCLSLRRAGYRNVVSAQARLHHYESTTRDATVSDDELARLRERWHDELHHDPYYNPNYGGWDNFPHPLRYP